MNCIPEMTKRFIPVESNISYPGRAPFVIKNAFPDWPATKKWTLDFFNKEYGSRLVPVRVFRKDAADHVFGRVSLRKYLEYLKERDTHPDRYYLADWEISQDFKPLMQDFIAPEVFGRDLIDDLPAAYRFRRTWIFIGHPEVHTPIHRDAYSTSAWLAQIQGKKRVRIIAPLEGELPESLFSGNVEKCCGQSGYWDICLEQGDLLYIPANFPHEIRNQEINLMLTKNFLEKPYVNQYLDHFEAKFRGLLNRIPQLKSQHS